MRQASRRDENERDIIEALSASGWGVHQINATGFPDLVIAKGKRTLLVEVIGPAKAAKYRRTGGLTPAQVRFHALWPGVIHKVYSVAEALQLVRCRL